MFKSYFLLLMMPVLVTAGQVLLKKKAGSIITGKGPDVFIKTLLQPAVIAAGLCVAAAPLFYITALRDVPLSEAFAFNSLNYLFVFVCGRLFLKEKINKIQVFGMILITTGFLMPIIVEAAGA